MSSTPPPAGLRAAGDAIPPTCEIIEVRVSELRRLFNSIDPSPFHDRDLDPGAEEFIVNWASELPGSVPFALLVHVERPAGVPDEAAMLKDAVHRFFGRKAATARRNLRELFRRGRISLIIGLTCLGGSSVLAAELAGVLSGGLGAVLRESLIIGGWVAMWRPLEVFLYDWWPIRAQATRYDRLAAMPVRLHYPDDGAPVD